MNIPDKAVEAAARALYDWSADGGDPDCSVPWEEQESDFKNELRKLVRIPLEAAFPHIKDPKNSTRKDPDELP